MGVEWGLHPSKKSTNTKIPLNIQKTNYKAEIKSKSTNKAQNMEIENAIKKFLSHFCSD
jgi:hypothetical protein